MQLLLHIKRAPFGRLGQTIEINEETKGGFDIEITDKRSSSSILI